MYIRSIAAIYIFFYFIFIFRIALRTIGSVRKFAIPIGAELKHLRLASRREIKCN